MAPCDAAMAQQPIIASTIMRASGHDSYRHHGDFAIGENILDSVTANWLFLGTLDLFWSRKPLPHDKFSTEMMQHAAEGLKINLPPLHHSLASRCHCVACEGAEGGGRDFTRR